jgi:2-polyprenyl-3-methyl-5-hydroxy-6-metoxy-1,4-benzoquinol methylase
LLEFTGERVIPGQVNDDLWAEHYSRYAFARRYVQGRRVLDSGCGSGYGAAELALSALSVVGLDLSTDAVAYAQRNFPGPNLRFTAGSCTQLPFRDTSFDIVVAFEVIEHLDNYTGFLDECARVLTAQGLLLVSSPNRLYYTESRGQTGANPYHRHEFAPAEFAEVLSRVFPQVSLLVQNQVKSFAFYPPRGFWPTDARMDSTAGNAETAHFLIALCGRDRHAPQSSFVYVPRAANLLREREQHIRLLEDQLANEKKWHGETAALFRKAEGELKEHNQWALQLDQELAGARDRIATLNAELEAMAEGYDARLRDVEHDLEERTQWAQRIQTEGTAALLAMKQDLEGRIEELGKCVGMLESAEQTIVERTEWAQRLEAERQRLAELLNFARSSRWVKLGRAAGVGPALEDA